jgi:hypothetical protein
MKLRVTIKGQTSERLLMKIDISELVDALASEHDSYDDFLEGSGRHWTDGADFGEHDFGLDSGSISFERETKEVLAVDLSEFMEESEREMTTPDAMFNGLRHDKGFYRAWISRGGAAREHVFTATFPDAEDDEPEIGDLMYDPGASDFGVHEEFEFLDDESTLVNVAELMDARSHKLDASGVLAYSRGSDDWASRHAEIVDLSELRAKALQHSVDLADKVGVASFLEAMLE